MRGNCVGKTGQLMWVTELQRKSEEPLLEFLEYDTPFHGDIYDFYD